MAYPSVRIRSRTQLPPLPESTPVIAVIVALKPGRRGHCTLVDQGPQSAQRACPTCGTHCACDRYQRAQDQKAERTVQSVLWNPQSRRSTERYGGSRETKRRRVSYVVGARSANVRRRRACDAPTRARYLYSIDHQISHRPSFDP